MPSRSRLRSLSNPSSLSLLAPVRLRDPPPPPAALACWRSGSPALSWPSSLGQALLHDQQVLLLLVEERALVKGRVPAPAGDNDCKQAWGQSWAPNKRVLGLAGEPGHLQAPCQCAGPNVVQECGPQTSCSSITSKPVRMGHLRPHLSPVHLNLHLNKIPGDQMHLKVLGEGLESPDSAVWSSDPGCDCASIHPRGGASPPK